MLSLPVADSLHGVGELGRKLCPIPQARISALRIEHDDLDAAIDALTGANTHDDLLIARLKKRRLRIRDEIAGLDAAIPAVSGEAEIAAPGPDVLIGAAPKLIGASFVFCAFVAPIVLLMLGLGWSQMADALNQTIAQIYLLSLLVAANG